MAWFAVDEDETESSYDRKPSRHHNNEIKSWYPYVCDGEYEELPKGSIEKLIGRKLTWEGEPVELKETR